jgi:hypothetical protein
MNDRWSGDSDEKKSMIVAKMLNRLLYNLIDRCTKDEGIRDYFHVGVIGYNNEKIGSALENFHPDRDLIPISELAKNPLGFESVTHKVPDSDGNMVDETETEPIWIKPHAFGNTPMCEVLQMAEEVIAGWVRKNPQSFPPIIINITDGDSTDGIPIPNALRIKQIETDNGNALLFNIHISETVSDPIMYPGDSNALPDDFARTLWAMSSVLPPTMQQFARSLNYPITKDSRGYGFNADMEAFSDFLDIGTRPTI